MRNINLSTLELSNRTWWLYDEENSGEWASSFSYTLIRFSTKMVFEANLNKIIHVDQHKQKQFHQLG